MALKLPPMKEFQSSNVEAMGWDTRGLFVRFVRGTIYQYPDVPQDVYEEGLKAESVGKWFASEIKGGGYAYEKHAG